MDPSATDHEQPIVSRDVGSSITADDHAHRLAQLHEATRRLMKADTKEAVAGIVADAADRTLGYPITVVRLVSDDGRRLLPVAVRDQARKVLGERPIYHVGKGTAGLCYERQEPMIFEDVQAVDDPHDRGHARAGMYLPIGRHGTLSVNDTAAGTFDRSDVALAKVLVANAEAALDRLVQEQELVRQNERLDEFASLVAHDLRNPLNVAKTALTLVRENGQGSERLELLDEALERMEALVEDVLALARQGERVLEFEPAELAEIVDEAWRTADAPCGEAEVAEPLGSIACDRGRAVELLENLFHNACVHAGENARVRVGRIEGGFYVEDDGPGIEPEERPEVFTSGYSSAAEGTGFGLSIVAQIAEAHGWEVQVTDGSMGGARFEITGVRRP